MGTLADAMDNLAHDLASSAAARMKGVEQLRVDTSELLTDARNLMSRLHMENEETLTNFRNALETEVKRTLGTFHKEHQHRANELRDSLNAFRKALENEVENTLGTFHKEHQHRANELRDSLNEFRNTLETEVQNMLNEFRSTTLAENAADCREAQEIWMNRPTAGRGPRAELARRPAEKATEEPRRVKPVKARKKGKGK